MEILGIDVGGSGIKGAPVDIKTGKLLEERHRIPTPPLARPKDIAEAVAELTKHFKWKGSVGCGFPAIISDGKAKSYGNLDESWVGVAVDKLFKKSTGLKVKVLNDADAAGIAEMTFGAGHKKMGLVLIITIGTGLGSGLFYNGQLVPNSELGHLRYKGQAVEVYAADSARKRESLSYEEWGKRFNFFLHYVNRVVSPDYIILGGGASKKLEKFKRELTLDIPIVAAKTLNQAGIIGAALAGA